MMPFPCEEETRNNSSRGGSYGGFQGLSSAHLLPPLQGGELRRARLLRISAPRPDIAHATHVRDSRLVTRAARPNPLDGRLARHALTLRAQHNTFKDSPPHTPLRDAVTGGPTSTLVDRKEHTSCSSTEQPSHGAQNSKTSTTQPTCGWNSTRQPTARPALQSRRWRRHQRGNLLPAPPPLPAAHFTPAQHAPVHE